jgi:Domain of unknown function (DUF3850)
MSNTHELKTWPGFFDSLWLGFKTFEIRRDDRGFGVGDVLILKEFNPTDSVYSGREIVADVVYSTTWKQKAGYIVMGIRVVARTTGQVNAETAETRRNAEDGGKD